MDHLAKRLSSFALDPPAPTDTSFVSKTGGVHAFDIVARILKDDTFHRIAPADFINQFSTAPPDFLSKHSIELLNKYYPTIREHAEQWTVDLDQPGEVERKTEELIWLSSLLYGVGGSTLNGFQPDFYLCVTSDLTRR